MIPKGYAIGLPSLEEWKESIRSVHFANRQKVKALNSQIEDTPSSSIFLDLSLTSISPPVNVFHGSGYHDSRHDASRAASCIGGGSEGSLQLIDLWVLLTHKSDSCPFSSPFLSSNSCKSALDERRASLSRTLQERASNALQPKRASAVVGNKSGALTAPSAIKQSTCDDSFSRLSLLFPIQ